MTEIEPGLLGRIDAIRRFNRFHTRLVGALNEDLLASDLPLVQVRLLYDLAHGEDLSAADLSASLSLNPGYLSRMLAQLEDLDLIVRTPDPAHAKRLRIELTAKGRDVIKELEDKSRTEILGLIGGLSEPRQQDLVACMARIESLLGGTAATPEILLREPKPGDLGTVVARQAELYAREYGWDQTFEGLVASIVADFIRDFDPELEIARIAEREGEVVGSVFVVKAEPGTAKLRLLYVDARVRGQGLGKRLVHEAISFARSKGYRELVLWTNAGLDAARAIYVAAGFQLVSEEPHHSFGHDLTGQYWSLKL
ncbi:MAG: bifunctional helix-turn-helix transcriptional regulator/GNAT family N-acetyltransferase [Hoeflea sp.]|nr:bifunctional helix-turn-helix transcriptional regulator/GNAT family N-acetyltransferase [Hoeflea sp.]